MSSQPRSVVILTGLNTEYRAVREHLTSICASRHAGTVFEEGRLTGSPTPVVLAVTGEGNNGAAVPVQHRVYAATCLGVNLLPVHHLGRLAASPVRAHA